MFVLLASNMAVEDFFTLTEMKDGLTSLPRVDELVSVMQKEKDNATKNLGDAARQWSTVAGVLASTENINCLNRFVQLDGLHFLNLWLQEAQKCADDSNENIVEEFIEIVLKVLEKMPRETNCPTASGINLTIENLSKRKGKYQERAKGLVNYWNQGLAKCADSLDIAEKGGTCCSEDKPLEDVKRISEESGREDEGCDGDPSSRTEDQNSNTKKCSDEARIIYTNDVEVSAPKVDGEADINMAPKGELPLSPLSNTCQEVPPTVEEPSACPENATTTDGIKSSQCPGEESAGDRSADFTEMKQVIDNKEVELKQNFEDDGLSKLNEQEQSVDTALPDTEENYPCPKRTSSSSSDSGSKDGKQKPCQDIVVSEISKVSSKFTMSQDGAFCPRVLQDKSASNALGKVVITKGLSSETDLKHSRLLNTMILSEAYKPMLSANGKDDLISTRTEMDLDDEEDALEVARLVGKEAAREVVHNREASCSFSGKNSESEIAHPGSSDSVGHNEEPTLENIEDSEEHSTSEDIDSSPKAKHSRVCSETDPEAEKPDTDSTCSVAPPKESVEKTSKDIFVFDLNEDVFTEETDCQITPASNQPSSTLSTPIPVIPVSKGCAGLPITPLHFEGELGWKGSAATSAFRRASPRRTADGDRSYLGETSSQGSKQRQNVLNFDLNVAENEEDPVIDLGSTKQIPVSSGLPSGESSVEVSSRKAERLKLDLNRIEDHDEPNIFNLSDRRVEGRIFHQLHQNGNRSPSSASSSSSRQPSMRDFDLNDNPSLFGPSLSHGPRQHPAHDNRSYGSFWLDDPIVSIMGSRMEVDRKDISYRTHTFLPNGPALESSIGSGMERMGVNGAGLRPTIAYAPGPPPSFGYNGITMGPAGSLPPQLYNHAAVPYMFDSRGTSVIPQIMGGPAAGFSPMLSRPPLFMSVTGPPSTMNGGAPRSGLDLNTGMGLIEGENQPREVGGLRHFFVQGHGALMDEQMKSGLVPGGAGLSLKRKEPECGWQGNMPGYKQETSWQR